jgi:prepilin-type N-terminal cleavage/methylation domain-containing protein
MYSARRNKTGVSAFSGTPVAFTLIEVLVVVAIIAVLVAILLPSLARAREHARTVTCRSNMHMLTLAFACYTHDNNGRYPGSRHDFGGDWLGWHNPRVGIPETQFGLGGRQPQDGTIYKYVDQQKHVYTCPSERANFMDKPEEDWFHSYTFNAMMTGCPPEIAHAAHHPTRAFDRDEHTRDMKNFDGVPLLLEAYFDRRREPKVTRDNPGWFIDHHTLANRHLKQSERLAVSNIGYIDGSVGPVLLPAPTDHQRPVMREDPRIDDYSDIFYAESMCIRTRSGRWVTMRSCSPSVSAYGFLHFASPANANLNIYPYRNVEFLKSPNDGWQWKQPDGTYHYPYEGVNHVSNQ